VHVDQAPRRLSREEKKAETRQRLLISAARLFAKKGYEGATIEEIAEEAGFSRGAFYSNFESKNDLLRSLLQLHLETQDATRRGWADAPSAAEHVRTGARWLMERTEVELILFLEFILRGARDEKFRPVVAGYWQSVREMLSEQIEKRAAEDGRPLPDKAENFASMVIAMGLGFALETLIDPERVPPDVFPAMLELVFTGAPSPDWKPPPKR
jgi:AcrR family transcriptional regulator